jgi:type I restriction enzyme M protein
LYFGLEEKRTDAKSILFIDASQHFEKVKPKTYCVKRTLTKSLHLKIKTEEDKYSHLAPLSEVETNDNLNIPRYVDTFEEEEAIDLKAITTELLAVLAIRQMQPSKFCTELGNRF